MKKLLSLLILTIFTFTSCEQNDTLVCPPGNNPFGDDPYGSVLNNSDCKGNSGEIQAEIPSTDEAISYTYFPEDKILLLKHINAALNCEPGKITADIKFLGSDINIAEKQSSSEARCNCLYDIVYDLRNIEAEIYLLTLSGPIIDGETYPTFSCYIDITENNTGEFSIYRGHYPWTE